MSARPDLAALTAKSAAFWAAYTPEPEWKPRHVLERIKHEQLEALNERTMSKFGDRSESQDGERFEGETPAVMDWNPALPIMEGESTTLAEHMRMARARISDATAAMDETADIEAAAMEADYLEKRRLEAELETLHSFRESTYVRHVRNRTGEVLAPEVYAKMRDDRAQLEEDTIELALRLESAARPALGTGPQTYLVGMLTGETKPCINVRKRAILPSVAAEKRAPIIRALEFLLNQPGHKFDQFCTFTHGVRVPIDPVSAGWELRQSFGDEKTGLHRRLSKLNAEPFMKLYGAEIIFRASEIGSLKDDKGELIRDEKGRVTAHPHAHCLIHFSRWLTKNHDHLLGAKPSEVIADLGNPSRIKTHPIGSRLYVYTVGRIYFNQAGTVCGTTGEMGEWTRAVWSFWGAHWSIDGAIEKVREACKYVVKPTDQKALSVAELAALDIGLFRLHRVQPMGELREQMKHRRESTLTIKKEWRVEAGKAETTIQPVVLADWNARKRDRKDTEEKKARRKLRARLLKAKKKARRESVRLANEERRAEWLKAHAKHIEKHAQLDLFVPPMPPPPVCPVDIKDLPLIARKAIREPVAFKNRIVARLAPAYYFGPISQPALMVWSDQPLTAADIAGMLSQSFVRPAVEAGRALYDRAAAGNPARPPKMRVHTSPVTVRDKKARSGFLPALLRPSTWEKTAALAAN